MYVNSLSYRQVAIANYEKRSSIPFGTILSQLSLLMKRTIPFAEKTNNAFAFHHP
jgi:hypothetical protein